MPYKDPAKAREQARAWRAANPGYGKRQYAKHREKRLAAKRAAYDPEIARARNAIRYAATQDACVAYAREYRSKNKSAVNTKARERYHANRDEINERRKGYRAKHYAKIYAAIQGWRKANPEREMLYHAKRLIAEQTGLAFRDIPDDVAGAKVVQLEITRWVRDAKAMEARRAETLGSIHESPVTEGDVPETPSEGVSNIKDKTDV